MTSEQEDGGPQLLIERVSETKKGGSFPTIARFVFLTALAGTVRGRLAGGRSRTRFLPPSTSSVVRTLYSSSSRSHSRSHRLLYCII